MKILLHNGYCIWLASRRLHQGKFIWTPLRQGEAVTLELSQLRALVVGLPWQYATDHHTIKTL